MPFGLLTGSLPVFRRSQDDRDRSSVSSQEDDEDRQDSSTAGDEEGSNQPRVEREPSAEDSEDEAGDPNDVQYEIEKVITHSFAPNGTLRLKIKWEGYKDPTWEPAAVIEETAYEFVSQYYTKIGGRPDRKRRNNNNNNIEKAKRKRTSDSLPTTRTDSHQNFQPPKGTWDNDLTSIDAVEEMKGNDGKMVRMAFVLWKNGRRSRHELLHLHDKCPKMMLQFYYDNLSFSRDPSLPPNS